MIAHNFKYWIMNIIHNILIHPLLPIADFLLLLRWDWAANKIYYLHDRTAPTLMLR